MDAVSGGLASATVGQFASAWAAGAACDVAFVGGGAAWAAARTSWPRCAGHAYGWLLSAMVWQKNLAISSLHVRARGSSSHAAYVCAMCVA